MKRRLITTLVLRNQRLRRRLTQAVGTIAGGGFLGGAVFAYFFDPKSGKRRRHAARDRTAAFFRRPAGMTSGKAKLALDKAVGLAHEARKSLNGDEVEERTSVKSKSKKAEKAGAKTT
jgi:hypothetical protein